MSRSLWHRLGLKENLQYLNIPDFQNLVQQLNISNSNNTTYFGSSSNMNIWTTINNKRTTQDVHFLCIFKTLFQSSRLHPPQQFYTGHPSEANLLQTRLQKICGKMQWQPTLFWCQVSTRKTNFFLTVWYLGDVLFRLVYETTYRDVVIPKNTSQVIYICCPGWSQIDRRSHGCNRRTYYW